MNVLIKGVGKKVKVKKRHKTRSEDDDLKGNDEKPFAPKASALEWCTCRHPILPENISQYFDAYRLHSIKENDNLFVNEIAWKKYQIELLDQSPP